MKKKTIHKQKLCVLYRTEIKITQTAGSTVKLNKYMMQ